MQPLPVKISLGPLGTGTVEVAGHDLSYWVHGVSMYGNVGELNEVNLELRPTEVEVSADALVTVPDELAEVLQLLGWTPPPDRIGLPQQAPADSGPGIPGQ